MSNKIDLVGGIPLKIRNQRIIGIIHSEAGMTMFFGVCDTVIHPSSRELCINLAGAVPVAGVRAAGCRVGIISQIIQIIIDTAGHQSEVCENLAEAVIVAPSEVAVHKNGFVIAALGVLLIVVCCGDRYGNQHDCQSQCQHQTNEFATFCHGFTIPFIVFPGLFPLFNQVST